MSKDYQIGDVITTFTYENIPSPGVGLIDKNERVWQIRDEHHMAACGGGSKFEWDTDTWKRGPFTVIFIPKENWK